MGQTSYKSYKNSNRGYELKQELSKYLRYLPIITGILIISISIVYVKLRYTKKQYQSNAKIKILSNTKGLELPQAGFIFSRPNINLENNIEIIKSSKIWEELVLNLNLVTTFYEFGNVLLTEVSSIPFNYELKVDENLINTSQLYNLEVREEGLFVFINDSEKSQIFTDYNTQFTSHDLPFELSAINLNTIKENIGKSYQISLTPVKEMASRLRQEFDVTVVGKNSDLLQLSFKGEIKLKSEKILNELMKVFELDGIRLRQEISERTINFIQERFIVLSSELDSIEVGIKDYKIDNNMISVETKVAKDMTKLSRVEEEMVALEAQFMVLNFIKSNIQAPLEKLEILPKFMNEESLEINTLIQEYNKVVFELDRLKTSAGSNNPQFKLLTKELNILKQNLVKSVTFMEVQLKSLETELLNRNKAFTATLLDIPGKEKYMRNIERQQRIKETLYLFLLQKREEAAINKAITEPSMQIVEYASSYWDPIAPNSKKLYITAVLLGVGIPCFMIYLLMFFDTKIKSLKDIQNILTKTPHLGELPLVKNKIVSHQINDNSSLTEAFRIFSSNLNFILPKKLDSQGQVVLCTSTIKGEGKTFLSINLARVEAEMGKRVLLIGGDLRNPQLHRNLNEINNDFGLTNLLHENSLKWKECIQYSKNNANFHIITAGPIPPNAPQLLNNGKLETILKEVKLEYDLIIIDTAPTLLVADTYLLTPLGDLTIFVARYGYTDKALLDYIAEIETSGKISAMALVLNGIKENTGYGYKYGYNYGYNYGYSNKK